MVVLKEILIEYMNYIETNVTETEGFVQSEVDISRAIRLGAKGP